MTRNNTDSKRSEDEEADDEICLTWRMDPEESLSDWTIEIVTKDSTLRDDGNNTTYSKIYHVHRNVLAVGKKKGTFFARLFRSPFSETETKSVRIELEKDAADAFPTLLDYMYSPENKLDVTVENIPALMELADYLDVNSVHEIISKYCHDNLTMETSATFYKYANDYGIPLLQSKAIDLCQRNLLTICPGTSPIVWDSQVKFWLDLRERFNEEDEKELLHLSQLVASFCSIHKEQLNFDDIAMLTSLENLPHIHNTAAEQLIQVELEKTNQNSSELSVLQECCIEALAGAWETHNFSVDKMLRFSPLVLSHLVTEIVFAAKIKVYKLSRSFVVQVQNAGVVEANGLYFLDQGIKDNNSVVRTCFKMEGQKWNGKESNFYLYQAPGSSSWSLVVLPKGSELCSDEEILLYYAPGRSRIPLLSGWTCSDPHGKHPVPTLAYY